MSILMLRLRLNNGGHNSLGRALCYQRQHERPQFTPLYSSAPLVLALTWIPRQGSTADAVRGVAERRLQEPARFDQLFTEIGHLAREGVNALTLGHLDELGELLNQNHAHLHALGVTTDELNALCRELRHRGALGAKMSGAGHGGVCLGLFEDLQAARKAVTHLNTPHWITTVKPRLHPTDIA